MALDFDDVAAIMAGKAGTVEVEEAPREEPAVIETDPRDHYPEPLFVDHPDYEGVTYRKVMAWAVFPIEDWKAVDFEVTQYQGFESHPLGVPEIDPVYIPNQSALTVLLMSDHTDLKALLVGHPGTGKTSLLEYFAAMLGRPFVRFNFDQTTDDAKLFGSLELAEGKTFFNKSDLTKSLSYPALLGMDEFSRANSFQTMLVNPLLDSKIVRVTSHDDSASEVVRAVEGWSVFGTDNTNGTGDDMDLYNSANVLDEAIRNRFDIFHTVPYMAETEERELIKHLSPSLEESLVKKLAKASAMFHKGYADRSITSAFSIRNLKAVLKLHSAGCSLGQALTYNFVTRVSDTDRPDVQETIRSIFGSEM